MLWILQLTLAWCGLRPAVVRCSGCSSRAVEALSRIARDPRNLTDSSRTVGYVESIAAASLSLARTGDGIFQRTVSEAGMMTAVRARAWLGLAVCGLRRQSSESDLAILSLQYYKPGSRCLAAWEGKGAWNTVLRLAERECL